MTKQRGNYTNDKQRGNYTNDKLDSAGKQVVAGKKAKQVSKDTKIPYRTLIKWVGKYKRGESMTPSRRGPQPRLTAEAERNLCEWVVGRQLVGKPAKRGEIIAKASAIAEMLSGTGVGGGWYRRFMKRHPTLAVRTSQSITKARNAVDTTDMWQLFGTLAKLYIEGGYSAERVFNVDETAFQTSTKTKKVIAARGSSNVWHTDAGASFHLLVVAYGSAPGAMVPPLFVLPGKTLPLEILSDCGIPGAAVTTTDSGFMNSTLFGSWLRFFAAAVPRDIPRPLLLIMDGCASHYSMELVDTATALQIQLVCLPANATHLFQPLDVAVFASFKGKLRGFVEAFTNNGGGYNIDKKTAIKLAALAWEGSNLSANIKAGFKECGLFPLSLPRMHRVARNGALTTIKKAAWLRVKETVQQELLVLPPPRAKSRKGKTASCGWAVAPSRAPSWAQIGATEASVREWPQLKSGRYPLQ